MSGVTVATISRSISRASRPAISSALRHAGSERSDIASVSAAIRRSRIPVRSRIHSSFVSTIVASSSFVTTRSGTWQPRPVIEIGRPFVRPIIREPRRSASRAPPARRQRSRAPCPLPTGPRAASTSQTRSSTSPGRTIRLKRTSSMPAKSDELASVLRLREDGDAAALGERLDHLHAGHDRVAGEVAGAVLVGHRLTGDDALARHQLEHLVDEQERSAVRDDRLDLGLAERDLRLGRVDVRHAESRSRSRSRPRWA